MLSSLLCGSIDQKRLELKSQNVIEGSQRLHLRSSSDEIQGKLIKTVRTTSSAMSRHNLVRSSILLACLLMAGCQFQYLQARASGKPGPCLCKEKFYANCPPSCIRAGVKLLEDDASNIDSLYEHDNSHPDHIIDDPVDMSTQLASYESKQANEDMDGDRVVWHRKIYVGEREESEDSLITPINITIPVTVIPNPYTVIPPPKTIFKMRKYSTYETDPQVEMMPVTTTVIKPVGVPEDQILESRKR